MPRQVGWLLTCECPRTYRTTSSTFKMLPCRSCGAEFVRTLRYARAPKKGAARDSQCSRVYKAERTLLEFREPKLDDWRRVVQAIVDSEPILAGINVGDGRRRRSACGGATGISIPRWARTHLILCHELAHVAAIRSGDHRTHGPEFVGWYLRLVGKSMGPDVLARLGEAFTGARIKMVPVA